MTTTKPLRQFGDWAVYADHIVNERAGYEIDIRLLESPVIDWSAHMAAKRWCNLADFERARDFLLWLVSDPGVLR